MSTKPSTPQHAAAPKKQDVSTGSSLYKEAVVDATKLRDITLQDAQNSILEALGPQIRTYVDKELEKFAVEGSGKKGFLILEQDEPVPAPAGDPMAPAGAAVPADPAAVPPAAPEAPMDAPVDGGVAPPPPESVSAAPINAAGSSIPLPGPDGKITVDLDSLFTASDDSMEGGEMDTPPEDTTGGVGATTVDLPATDAAAPAPVEPVGGEPPADAAAPAPEATPETPATPEVPIPTDNTQALAETGKTKEDEKLTITFESFDEVLGLAEHNIKTGSGRVSEGKLLRLYEILKENKKPWKLNETIFTLVSDRIEILLEKLDETNNSYTSKGKQSMTTKTLKEFAKSLLEDSSAGFGDAGKVKPKVNNSNESDKPSNHAMKASEPKVKDPGKKDSLDVPGTPVKDTAKGISEDASGEMDMAEQELMEMMGEMAGGAGDKEYIPADEEKPFGGKVDVKSVNPKVGDKKTALESKIAALREEQEKLMSELMECGDMGEMHDGGAEGVNVNITIDAPPGAVSVGGAGGAPEVGMGDMGGSSLAGLSDDDEIEIVDDEGSADQAVGGGMVGGDDEGDEDALAGDEGGEEEEAPDADMSSKMLAENKMLKTQLEETQLLTARSLYVNKLFAAHDLSGKLKHGIVKYLDSAKTIAEAKAAYGKIKTQLNEASKKSGNTQSGLVSGGNSAKAATPASGRGTAMNEGVNAASPLASVGLGTAERWQELAGIKVSK